VEQAIPGHRRPGIHARILAALRDPGCEDHARPAFHSEAAGPWLCGEAAAWVRRTGPSGNVRGELAEPYRLQLDGDRRSAAKLWDEIGCSYDAARHTRCRRGACLRQALDICQDLGAAVARIIRGALRRLDIRSIPVGQRAATREHPLGKTRREREVLALVCAGYTNAEIGAKLFISAKTIDHHVSGVLGKLGAPTRQAAASQAARLGLASAARGRPVRCRRRAGPGRR
jgi:DNA-binding CsgD family transcriptional regulator